MDRTTYVGGSSKQMAGGSSGSPVPVREQPAAPGGSSNSTWKTVRNIAACLLVFSILAMAIAFIANAALSSGPGNTVNREKLELGYGYPDDTLTDEIGWIHDPSGLNRELKAFYEETGAIPYVALVSRPEVTAEGPDAEWEYADAWYSENLPNEGYVLFMYFDPGTGEDGNGQLVVGDQAGVLMDAQAQDVFWEYMDSLWTQDIDEDAMFARAFNKTASRIMQKRTETKDVIKYLLIFLGVLALTGGGLLIFAVYRIHEAERAAETERILKTPVKEMEDPLLKQYGGKD